MNALYVTVCIPLLLVLAGFNHAHGFTTFGKTQNQQTPPPPPPHVPAKLCGNHTDCYPIPQTSCIETRNPSRKSCLCGDNKVPVNGQCRTEHKGPHHMCSSDNECVDGATCLPMGNGITASPESQKICKCLEGYTAVDAECSRADQLGINAALALLLVALCRTLF